MPNKDAIIAKAAGAFDKVRPGLMPGCRMFLLSRIGETSQFTVVFEITSGFWSRWSEFREQSVFMWASTATEYADRLARTNYVGLGVPDAGGKIDVYAVSSDQRDRIPPQGSKLIWKLYGVRNPKIRFTIPTP